MSAKLKQIRDKVLFAALLALPAIAVVAAAAPIFVPGGRR